MKFRKAGKIGWDFEEIGKLQKKPSNIPRLGSVTGLPRPETEVKRGGCATFFPSPFLKTEPNAQTKPRPFQKKAKTCYF
jgi:hypothetical protein